MTVEDDIRRHDKELEKLRELAMEASSLAQSATQSFEQVVAPAILDLDDVEKRISQLELVRAERANVPADIKVLSDRLTILEGIKGKLEGAVTLVKVGGGLLVAAGVIIEILRATGRI